MRRPSFPSNASAWSRMRRSGRWNVVFAAKVSRSADQIEASLDAVEHRGLWRCEANDAAIRTSLDRVDGFTPVGVGTLMLTRHHVA